MDGSKRARAIVRACAVFAVELAFTTTGYSDGGTESEWLATAHAGSSQVAHLCTPDGSTLYAGGSILRLEHGKLREVVRLADTYQLSVRPQPQVFPMVSDQGAIYLEDGRLLLLRQAMRPDSDGQPVFDHMRSFSSRPPIQRLYQRPCLEVHSSKAGY